MRRQGAPPQQQPPSMAFSKRILHVVVLVLSLRIHGIVRGLFGHQKCDTIYLQCTYHRSVFSLLPPSSYPATATEGINRVGSIREANFFDSSFRQDLVDHHCTVYSTSAWYSVLKDGRRNRCLTPQIQKLSYISTLLGFNKVRACFQFVCCAAPYSFSLS